MTQPGQADRWQGEADRPDPHVEGHEDRGGERVAAICVLCAIATLAVAGAIGLTRLF